MSSSIEVPRELIEAEDWEAIRKLIEPEEPLFGRWATHQELGRVLVMSERDGANSVYVKWRDEDSYSGFSSEWLHVKKLAFDPLTLTTREDFKNAPIGTIVSRPNFTATEKYEDSLWCGLTLRNNLQMAERGTWEVVRWGQGEQA